MNRAYIIGHLTDDAQTSAVQGGEIICACTVAVMLPNDKTDYYNIAYRGQRNKEIMYDLKKGKRVLVVGNITMERYIGKDKKERCVPVINADAIELLMPRGKRERTDDTKSRYAIDQPPHPGLAKEHCAKLPF